MSYSSSARNAAVDRLLQAAREQPEYPKLYREFVHYTDPKKLACFTGGAKWALDVNIAEWVLANTAIQAPLAGTRLLLFRVRQLRGSVLVLENVFDQQTVTAKYPRMLPRLKQNEICGLRIVPRSGGFVVGYGIYRFVHPIQTKLADQILKDAAKTIPTNADDETRMLAFIKIIEDYIIHTWVATTAEIESAVAQVTNDVVQ